MPDFAYTARDRTGRVIEGTIEADNSALAAGRVRALGYEVERIRAAGSAYGAPRPEVSRGERSTSAPPAPNNGGASLGRRAKENLVYPVISGVLLKDLAVFYRQLATMIHAGIPLYQSLVTLENQTRNEKLREVLRASQRQVEMGGKLSEVFAAYPWIFSRIQIEMLRAAEQGGLLDEMLNRISDYLEQELALKRMISRLTIYPRIVVFIAWMLLGVRFFVDMMPAFSKLIIGMMKPEAVGGYNGWSYLLDTVGSMALLGLIAFGIYAFCRIVLFQNPNAREGYERMKMGLPGVGEVAKKFALARFGRSFGAMYAGGLALNTAIRVAGDASGSRVIQHATERALHAIERGSVLSQAFAETGVFPPIVLDMLHTGEQTGNVDGMMVKVSEYLEGDAEAKAHLYSHIFAAAVGLLVALLIGIAVIRFYMGYIGGISAAAGGDSG
jgi:type II secretory pathway component PulF